MSLATETASYLNLSPISGSDFSANSPVSGNLSSGFDNTKSIAGSIGGQSTQINIPDPLNALFGPATATGGTNLLGAITPLASSATQSLSDFFSEFFLRAVVIITGFIFVGVGLSMFQGGRSIIQKVKGAVS